MTEIPQDLQALADLPTPRRVQNRTWRGREIWIKRASAPQNRFWRLFHSVVSFLLPVSAFRPGICLGGAPGLRREARAIEKLHAEGFETPGVIAVTDRWLALEHLGVTVDTYLKTHSALTAETVNDVVAACARELARLHQKGLHHGRAKLNDFIRLPDGRIGFIDFEEDLTRLPRESVEARELWFMISSACRYNSVSPDVLRVAMQAYEGVFMRDATRRELKRIAGVMRPLHGACGPFEKRLKGDLRRAYDATSFFLEYLA